MFKQRLYIKSGFTLIEIIIAAGIMAVTIGGIFSVFIAGTKFVSRSQRRLQATNVAQEEIERRRVFVRYDTWNDSAQNELTPRSFTGWVSTDNPAFPVLAVTPEYRYQVTTDPQSSEPNAISDTDALCRQAYMQVRWPEPQ